ncbi:SRPBCC family protein [Rhizobium leguminosarum]|uniref:SRPBCC family protein n=1 Tax=Rhizobium leguminosarum TaxID=384 RepID=UPI001C988AB1|nr:SRPBCC family protein [Rhizobium leguminosarum]MBY5327044.1 SRPBCC family protein [Rhizobium leguminosarum]
MTTMPAKIIHRSIERDWRDVYEFAGKPENMPLWASGLATGLDPDGADWIADGALGKIRVSFVPTNEFGVIDHTVTIESGLRVYNALRIVPNGGGCEVMFTLLRLPGMTDAQFSADAAHVEKDLAMLKALMER